MKASGSRPSRYQFLNSWAFSAARAIHHTGRQALFVLLTFWLVLEFLRRYYPHIHRDDMMMLLIG